MHQLHPFCHRPSSTAPCEYIPLSSQQEAARRRKKTHPTYVRIMGTLPYGIPFPFRRSALGPYKKDEVNIRLSLSHNERVQILSLAAAISPARPLYIYGVVLRSLQLND